jgi:hypothetical protein
MKRALYLFPILIFLGAYNTSPALALQKQCYDDSISQVSQSGEIVRMTSGHIYEIDSYDTFDTMMWLPAEAVLICETSDVRQGRVIAIYDIINTDQGSGKIWAHKLK